MAMRTANRMARAGGYAGHGTRYTISSGEEDAVPDHNYFANLIWQIADLLRGPYRPPQYERVMLPMTVLRRFDCVLAPTKNKVLASLRAAKARQD